MGWCGPNGISFLERIIPDIYHFIFRADFSKCCKEHDILYEIGGDEKKRMIYDMKFYRCLKKEVLKTNFCLKRKLGLIVAKIYFKAVRVLGSSFFNYTKILIFFLFFLHSVVFASLKQSLNQTKIKPSWPIKENIIITSSFMEDRPARFHAGIDLKTYGKNLPIYLPEDAYLIRLNISPWGYGKAIYFQGKSGYIYVFGHCSDFIPLIDTLIMKEQIKRKRYRVNFFIKRKLKFSKNTLIGYTGETGIGYPHLHFEIRDKNNRPLNPFNLGYSIVDSIPPNILKVYIIPLNDTSLVNNKEFIFSMIKDSSNKDTVDIKGVIGISILGYDKILKSYKGYLYPYKFELFLDDSLIFRHSNDYFSYSEVFYSLYDRLYYVRTGFKYLKPKNLFILKNNNATFYKKPFNKYPAGIIFTNSLDNNIHKIKIKIYDYNQNYDSLLFFIRKQKVEFNYTLFRPNKKHTFNWVHNKILSDYLKNKIELYNIFLDTLYYPLLKGNNFYYITFHYNGISLDVNKNSLIKKIIMKNKKGVFVSKEIEKNRFFFPYHTLSKENIFFIIDSIFSGFKVKGYTKEIIYKYIPDSTIIVYNDSIIQIKASKYLSPETTYFKIEIEKPKIKPRNDIKLQNELPVVKIRGKWVPSKGNFIVYYRIKKKKLLNKKYGFYTYGKYPKFLGKKIKQDSIIFVRAWINSSIAYYKDEIKPKIYDISVQDKKLYKTKPILTFKIDEKGSGIWSDKQIKTFVNGKFTINEYNPERKSVKVLYPDYIKEGKNVFKIIVKDNAGNIDKKEIIFYYKKRE